ncbi:MAG: response regulator transcription factor [Opitutaceae bacterium]|nr:response regulator transcription factor [Opitutaceae bacterium]
MTPHQRRILIVEDDASIREALIEAVEGDGHAAVGAPDGAAAVRLFGSGAFDLVLLDIMLPVMSGYDVCRRIREKDKRVPVVMLTAKGEEIDKVLGLELGADDYVTKPFGQRELLARIHAAFRRADLASASASSSGGAAPASVPDDFFLFGPTRIDRRRFTATRDGATQMLSAKELHLIEVFHRRRGEVLSRDALLNEVWGIDYLGTTRTLDQHVAQVRKKVEGDRAPQLIKTIHGVGYQYVG